jgi:hypothetical protein
MIEQEELLKKYQQEIEKCFELALHCFSNGLKGSLADSVRRCYNAMTKGTPYRLTQEFDNLITLSYGNND